MDLFYPVLHGEHAPTKDYSDGFPPFDFMEVGKRLDLILEGIGSVEPIVRHDVEGTIDRAYLERLHRSDYLEFLEELCGDLAPGEEYIPSIFRDRLERAPLRFRGGMYCSEIGTPLMRGTWRAAENSAQTVLEATEWMMRRGCDVWAMTRPPGHHAHVARYGGYSFLNNAAVAVVRMKEAGYRAVVLDIDYHIGDGTVEFSEKLGFSYYSLHIDPWRNYPYFSSDTKFPESARLIHLPHETTAVEYLNALKRLLKEIATERYDYLILSLGFDILASDYCQDEFILIENRHMEEIAREIRRSTEKPVLIALEGGYDQPNLAEAGRYFMKGWVS